MLCAWLVLGAGPCGGVSCSLRKNTANTVSPNHPISMGPLGYRGHGETLCPWSPVQGPLQGLQCCINAQ
ncbi:unnamed protein product [Boreogadus saida]